MADQNTAVIQQKGSNIGIGTNSPGYKLDVNGNARVVAGIQISNTNSDLYASDGALSYYSTTNGVYLNGAGANGWLRLNGSGVENYQNCIDIYGSGGSRMEFRIGNGEKIRINTTGVGISTTTPQVTLDINGNTGITSSNYLYFGHSTTNIGAWQTRTYSSGGVQYWNVNGFQINNTGYGSSTWLNVNSSGYVRVYERLGVGTDPSFKIHVLESGSTISSGNAINGSTMKGITVHNSNNDNSSVGIWFTTNGSHWTGISSQRNDYTSTWGTDLRFYTHENATNDLTYSRQRMIITSEGAMGLGVTPSNTGGRFEASNDIVAYSSSDIRFKNNVLEIDNPLAKISKIRGVYFDWIEMEEFHGNKGHDIGVIAQEVEEVLPEIVTTRDNGYKAVKYERMIPLLIESVKELSKENEDLKTRLKSLEDRIGT